MRFLPYKELGWGVIAALAVGWLPLAASAGTINVILSDVDVTYFGGAASGAGALYDTIGYSSANADPSMAPANADEVETAVFEFDMVSVGALMTGPGHELYGDMKIDGVGASVPLGVFQTAIGNNGGGFGFDWFDADGQRLRLGIDKIDMLLSAGVLFFTGTGTVLDQNLPFLLEFDTSQNVVFSYVASLPGIVGGPGAQTTSNAMASGAMTISGEGRIVPEPTTIGLMLLGAAAGLARLRSTRAT